MKEARVVVEGAKDARAVPWNLLIRACNRKGFWKDAIFSYKMMCELGVGADVFTYPSVLRACGEVFDLNLGKVIHGCVNKRGLEWDLYVWNSLIGMYVKCEAVDVAREVFDEMGERDVVTWNCMISGYASEGTWEKAFELLQLMPENVRVNTITWNTVLAGNLQMGNYVEVIRLISQMANDGLNVDYVTLVIGLKACSRVENVKVGKEIHGLAIRLGLNEIENITNALITMYSKGQNTNHAYVLFRMSLFRSLVTWNAMLTGFGHMGRVEEASLLLREMIFSCVRLNYVTVITMVLLSAHIENLRYGSGLHCFIIKRGFEGYQLVQNSLVDMYSKSGKMSDARKVFGIIRFRDKIPYTSLILGYGKLGQGITSLKLFDKMVTHGIDPDHITMVAILASCSHSGLVTQGQILFEKMVTVYGIIPKVEHFSCMVDLYCRAGLLKKAEEIIGKMPLKASAAMLATLIEACRVHGNIEIGERAAKKLLNMRSNDPSHYILIGNFYSYARFWPELAMVKSVMRDMGLRNSPSCSWLDKEYGLCRFKLDDMLNQQENSNLMLLGVLSDHMKDDCYAADEEKKYDEAVGG